LESAAPSVSGFTDDETEIPEQVQTCIDDGDDPGATQDPSAHQAKRIADGGPLGSIGQGQRSATWARSRAAMTQ
jgi:hypothetical protein